MAFFHPHRLATWLIPILLGSAVANAAVTHTTHNLNMRSGPETTYPPVAVIPGGAAIDVISCGATWCHIHWAGHLGYVNGYYLATHATVVVAPLMHISHESHVTVVSDVTHVVHVHHVHTCSYLFC